MNKQETNEEKVETPSSEKEQMEKEPSEISGVSDAVNQYEKAQAEKSAKATEEKQGKKEEEPCKPCATTEEELKTEGKTPEPSIFLVDKDGKKVPIIGKADGKEHVPDSIDKVLTWVNYGIHRKSEKDEIEQAKTFLDFINRACEEGRILVDGKRINPKGGFEAEKTTVSKEEEEEEEPEDELIDPEMKSLKKEVKELKEYELKKIMTTAQEKLESEIEEKRKDHFAAYTRTEEDPEDGDMPLSTWTLLAKHPEYNVEKAMKLSHDSMVNFFNKMAVEHPELLKDRDNKAVANYLKDKEEREKAPVSPPSELPAGTPPTQEEKEFKGVSDAMRAYEKTVDEREKAGQKS